MTFSPQARLPDISVTPLRSPVGQAGFNTDIDQQTTGAVLAIRSRIAHGYRIGWQAQASLPAGYLGPFSVQLLLNNQPDSLDSAIVQKFCSYQ
jgi:hypothetical protein